MHSAGLWEVFRGSAGLIAGRLSDHFPTLETELG